MKTKKYLIYKKFKRWINYLTELRCCFLTVGKNVLKDVGKLKQINNFS